MTPPVTVDPEVPRRGSRAWTVTWRVLYALVAALDPLIRAYLALGGWGYRSLVELRVVGRRTGRVRSVVLTLLPLDGRWYLGHPNGPVPWTRNLEAAGEALLVPLAGREPDPGVLVRGERLPQGEERDRVIRATSRLQPFPANVLYRASRRHILAVGDYHRLEVLPSRSPSPTTPEPRRRDPSPTLPEVP